MSQLSARPGFRPDIQGLRAVAVLSVLAYHAGIPGAGGGYLGVDVFFVISGYLIGGQLVREILGTGRIDFAAFYARRGRRILPASLLVIVATVAATLLLAPPLRAIEVAVDAIWAALSAANIRFAVEGTDYLAGTTPSPLQHYWSLGVEEQFYLVIPVLLIVLALLLRRRPRAMLAVGIALAAVSLVVCLLTGVASPWTYFGLPARAWELAVGVFAAVAGSRMVALRRWPRELAAALGLVGLAVSGWLGAAPGFPHPGIGTLLPVLATAVIIVAGEPAAGAVPAVSRALGVRPAVAIGTLSFSLYLVHWPMLELAHENTNSEQPLPLLTRVVLALAAIPVAWLLYRFVERPFLTRARLAPAARGSRRTLITAGATIAVLVAVLGIAAPALAARPLTSSRTAATGVEHLPTGTAFVPRNVHPALAGAVADTGELYAAGCQQGTSESALKVCSFGPDDGASVVLFGDSHAARWFPALEAGFDGRPVRLTTLTKSGCRSIESATLWSGAENRSCAEWRASAVAWLEAHPPQLIVLADHLGRSTSSADQARQQWSDAVVSSLGRLPSGVPVAVMAETPEFDFSPPVCLSRHLDDADACAEARSSAVDEPVIAGEREGALRAGATLVDLTDWFCNRRDCPTVIGSSLVYSDEHHLTASFSGQLASPVRSALQRLIADR